MDGPAVGTSEWVDAANRVLRSLPLDVAPNAPFVSVGFTVTNGSFDAPARFACVLTEGDLEFRTASQESSRTELVLTNQTLARFLFSEDPNDATAAIADGSVAIHGDRAPIVDAGLYMLALLTTDRRRQLADSLN